MKIETEVLDCVNDILNKIVKKEYNRHYRQKNKEKVKEINKQYRQKNKEKAKEYREGWCEKNKEKMKEYAKKHNNTLNSIKLRRIGHWKNRGIITDNYDALYNHYLNTEFCDACRVRLTYDRYNSLTTKVVDHDHTITDAPNFRNILCHPCNIKRK